MKKSKYNSIKTSVNGYVFDSKLEAERYKGLKLLQAGKQIKGLKLQVPYSFWLADKKMFTYYADFLYFDVTRGKWIVEDVKGVKTQVYRLKKKLIEAFHHIEISEYPGGPKDGS